jgi:hypothetical protein
MKTNEAGWDRTLRVVLGLGILAFGLVPPHSAWALLGVIPLLTGLVGFCPLYAMLGISTCSTLPRGACLTGQASMHAGAHQ